MRCNNRWVTWIVPTSGCGYLLNLKMYKMSLLVFNDLVGNDGNIPIDLLAHWTCGGYLNLGFFKLKPCIDILGISCEIALMWMPWDLTDDLSILVHLIARCGQTPSHNLRQFDPDLCRQITSLIHHKSQYETVPSSEMFLTEKVSLHPTLIWHSQSGVNGSRENTGKPHDYTIIWKHVLRYWPFVRGIHRSPVNSPQKRSMTRSFGVFFETMVRLVIWDVIASIMTAL